MPIRTLLFSTAGALTLASCAALPFQKEELTFAEQLVEIEESWTDGRKDVERGKEMISEGEDKLEKNRKRRERRLASLEATEKEIDDLRVEISGLALTAGTAEIDDKADRLKRLQGYAKEHAEEAEDAADDIRDARKKITRGEALVEAGTREMEEAERRYYQDAGKALDKEMAERLGLKAAEKRKD